MTIYRVQGINSVVDGAVLTTVVLYFSHVVGLAETSVGLVLSAAAAASLVLATPLGRLADRVGLRRVAAVYAVAIAGALVAYGMAHTLWAYAAAAVLFTVARAGIASTIQAIVAAESTPDRRVSARGRLHTLLNAGFGAGAVIGAGVLAVGRPAGFVALFVVGAVAAAASAAMFGRLHSAAATSPAGTASRPAGRRGALRDGRLVTITALNAVLLLTMPILSVLLPLWLVSRTAAPAWVAAVALGLNTVLVVVLQSPWSARVRDDATAARSALAAGGALVVACLLFAAMPGASPAVAGSLALAGAAALTVGEVAAGPASWHLAMRDTPAEGQGEYQAVFGMSASLARILGPLLGLPLLATLGSTGWVILGLVILSAATGLALTARCDRTIRLTTTGGGAGQLRVRNGASVARTSSAVPQTSSN